MIGIYSIKNKINNKIYIGYSIDIYRRWQSHKRLLELGKHENEHLQHSYDKYGADAFEYSIIEECTVDELQDKEKFYIKKFNSLKEGYNQTEGGDGLPNPSDELKKKLHELAILRECWKLFPDTKGENNPNYGKHPSEETRKKMSEKAKSRPRQQKTDEQKQKISNIAKENNYASHFGNLLHLPLSEDAKRKIGKANSRSVIASTGEIFESIKQACEWCHSFNVTACCVGKQKTAGIHPETGERLSWQYYNEELVK